MRIFRVWRGVAFVLVCGLLNSAVAAPKFHLKEGFPDFDQSNGSLGQGGNYHCSPTSAANSLTWFDKNGLDVVPPAWTDSPPANNQHTGLIDQLGKDCKTNGPTGAGQVGGEWNGTWNDDYVKGLRKYLSNPDYNKSGKDFDVKHQGTKYFKGYTVGSMGASVDPAWLRSESADNEDVSLTIDWWLKNAAGQLVGVDPAGNYVVGGGNPLGAHTISMRGYTEYGGEALFIKDPGTHELIVERDPAFPGRLIYEYTTPPWRNGMKWVAEVVAAVSVSPKDRLVSDGIVDIWEYDPNPPQVTTPSPVMQPYTTDYIDYVSIGIDAHGILVPLDEQAGHIGHFEIMNPMTMNGYLLAYDHTGLLAIARVEAGVPSEYFNDEFLFKLTSDFAPSEMRPEPHVQTELFLNREVFGDLPMDTMIQFRAWTTEFEPMSLGFEMPLSSQSLGWDDPTGDPFPVPWTYDMQSSLPFEVPLEPDPAEIALEEYWASFVPIAGDMNEDGYVGSADLDIVRANWGNTVQPGDTYAGDANGDGRVGSADLDTVRSNWGQSRPPVPIPELSAGILLVLGIVTASLRRGRK